jgi:hypothetical protein
MATVVAVGLVRGDLPRGNLDVILLSFFFDFSEYMPLAV